MRMPSAPVPRARPLAVLAAALLFVTGCGTAGRGEPDLLNDLAARLDRAGDLTFTAEYRLGDGAVAVLAQGQDPRRAAYVYPGGKSVSTETQLATCRAGAAGDAGHSTLTPPPSSNVEPALDLLAASDDEVPGGTRTPGLVAPSVVLRMLSTAVLDGATVARHDSTIAGEPATCVGVYGPDGFTACVTARGVLGSFTGPVRGELVTFELTSFASSVDADTFALPPGVTIDDRRPR
jgi:hypothetical protein